MLLYRDQNARQNQDIKVAKRSFKNCGTVQIFGNGSNRTDLIQGEMKRRFDLVMLATIQSRTTCVPIY
jgi:hypothetical protein